MEKKFVTVNFDKFNQTTTTRSIPMSQFRKTTVIIVDRNKGIGSFSAGLRHVKKPDLEVLAVDVHYSHKDWVFLRNGKLSFVIDNENVAIDAVDAGTNVVSGGDVEEDAAYPITSSLLEKIGSSNEFAMRISGSQGYVDIDDKLAQLFKTMCKQFYNNVFDSTKFTEALQTSVLPKDQKGSGGTGGCFIATAAMGDYDHPVVMDLREFRDNWLLKRDWGVKFTSWYYTHGPKAANVIEKSIALKKITFFLIVKPLQFITKKLK
jgi:hypothetical protein